ncbi:hypothetical protein ADP64_000041 [Achromobacter phage phiAxp-2]|uniref:Uncharacterized protein n=1 Tax=Achromobacter phage phiAxp-2 TaxID=1664246 RepID=A0A0K2FIF7_9CAUD|nr:hypothetical protein ADP64_000041 [Achromobacter phage phiAxp-2]ALA45429.1 hypothetical protein ADP64_000041 [Achromobacter phage phiAxp-2]
MNKQHDIAQRVLTTEQRNEFIRRTSFISESDRDTRAAFVDEIARAALASAPVADERPAFEAYARRNGYPLNGHGGFYGNNRTRNQWMGWKARAAMASAPVATRQYHYRMSNCTPGRPECRDGNGYPECPCWHDVGTGPLAGKEATATNWRDKPSAPVQWPTMPPSKGQSPVLFEDGYAEGWAKCMDECRRALVAASNYIDKLGGDSKTYRAALASAPVDKPAPEHFKPPFDNCSFRMCDLPGQCRGEGKCHHPASAPVAGEAQAQGKLVAVLNVVENGFGRTVDVEMLEAGNQLPTGRWAVRLAAPAE